MIMQKIMRNGGRRWIPLLRKIQTHQGLSRFYEKSYVVMGVDLDPGGYLEDSWGEIHWILCLSWL